MLLWFSLYRLENLIYSLGQRQSVFTDCDIGLTFKIYSSFIIQLFQRLPLSESDSPLTRIAYSLLYSFIGNLKINDPSYLFIMSHSILAVYYAPAR